jgi:hypothetical protein
MPARAKIALLSFFFAACLGSAVFTAWLQMRADENIKPADLYAVVNRQLGSLRDNDFSTAYQQASSAIQARYNLQQFADMLQAQYPGITQIARAEYGEVLTRGRHATMQVYLIGEDGHVIPGIYMLVHEGDNWRIDGARLQPPWPTDVRIEGTLL